MLSKGSPSTACSWSAVGATLLLVCSSSSEAITAIEAITDMEAITATTAGSERGATPGQPVIRLLVERGRCHLAPRLQQQL